MKWIAAAAIIIGIGLIIDGFATMGNGTTGLDRLPFTMLLVFGGGVLIVGGVGYFIVRGFMALG